MAADWILANGRVLTLDAHRPRATALAVAAVGDRVDVKAWRDRRTQVVDLRGATVVPGLVDAHAHLDREGLKSQYPPLAHCRSIGDIQVLVYHCFDTEDFQIGYRAFLAKTTPRFVGR